MTKLFNQNWIGVDGEPVTGKVPTTLRVQFKLLPGSGPIFYTPTVPPQVLGSTYHAYKLFCDAVANTPHKDLYHVQNRNFTYMVQGDKTPRTAVLRMTSNQGIHTADLTVPIRDEDSEYAGHWLSFCTYAYDIQAGTGNVINEEITFNVYRFTESFNSAKRMLKKRLLYGPTDSKLEAYAQAVTGNTIYWVKVMTNTSPVIAVEPYVRPSNGDVWYADLRESVKRMTLIKTVVNGKSSKDKELGFFESKRYSRTWYFLTPEGVRLFNSSTPPDDITAPTTPLPVDAAEGLQNVSATPWGMIVLDEFDPTAELAGSIDLPQRRSYFCDPRNLKPLPVVSPEPATYAIDWTSAITAEFTPPVAGTPYTKAQVKTLYATYRWSRVATFGPSTPSYTVSIPKTPTLWPQYVDWVQGGYVAPRYTDQTFASAGRKAFFQYGDSWPSTSVNLLDMGVGATWNATHQNYFFNGLWTELSVFVTQADGDDLVLCQRKYATLATEKRVTVAKYTDLAGKQNYGVDFQSARLGRDALEVMTL